MRHELLSEEPSSPKQRITKRVTQIMDLSNNRNLQARRRELKTRWELVFRGLELFVQHACSGKADSGPSVGTTGQDVLEKCGDSKGRKRKAGPVGGSRTSTQSGD